mmetsp:Transcript_63337/g.196163  ORF Transcript_63337/g.196163 Transcript_63337/m.196163 type:complete len:493 (+) Transcript_63337:112-1590(+)
MSANTDEEPETKGFLVAGIILAVLASMSGTAGKQALRFSELQRRKGTTASACMGKIALACGLALNVIVGPLIDMGSYAFAPQSVIAPLGGLDVVWNTLTAPFTLGETLTPRVFLGCAVITAGAIITSLTGSHDSGEFDVDMIQVLLFRPTVAVYLVVLLVWVLFNVLVLMPRSAAPKGQPWQSGDRIRGLSLGMTAGSIAGNMFCVKAFVEVVQDSIVRKSGDNWLHWLPYSLFIGALFFAFSNLYFLTKAMREYEALFMGAIFEGSLIISACLSGVVVFSELEPLQPYQVGLYWAAIVSLVGGIYVVTTGSSPQPAEDAYAADKAGEQDEEVGAKEGAEMAQCPDGPCEEGSGGQHVCWGRHTLKDEELQSEGSTNEPKKDAGCMHVADRPSVQCLCPVCANGGQHTDDGLTLHPAQRPAGRHPPKTWGRKHTHVGVVPSSALPHHLQGMNGVSCLCNDGASCFCGMHFLRSKRTANAPSLAVPGKPVLST